MDAHQAAGILAIGPGFAAETRRISRVFDRHVVTGEHFAAVQICDRHLGGGDEKQVVLLDQIHIIFQLGELAGAKHNLSFGDERRKDFCIAVLFNVHVNHKIDQSPLQPGAQTAIADEKRTGQI